MDIVFTYDSTVGSAPSGFKTALADAATYLDQLITNNITVNIDIGWGEVDNQSLGSDLAATSLADNEISYSRLKTALYDARDSSATDTAYANLPATDPSSSGLVSVAPAQEKAWGILPANASAIDAWVGFSSSYNFDFSSTGAVPSGEYDFIGIAEHELTHALGRTSLIGQTIPILDTPYPPTLLDLYRYTGAGVLATTASQSAYFSIDGGTTNLNNFSTSSDLSDWASSAGTDSFDAYLPSGTRLPMSATDVTEMNVLGYAIANCFVTGTRIATPAGEAPVEALRPGDRVALADGGTAEVRWIGRQSIAARFADPLHVWPVRIRAGALDDGVPHRDLLLSPGHAVRVGGVLAHAAALVNGSSIVRETQVSERFTYWHVELDTHALLLAEGAPTESYLDAFAEFGFDNAEERAPDANAATELPHPRCKSPRQVPRAIHEALARRANAMGWAA